MKVGNRIRDRARHEADAMGRALIVPWISYRQLIGMERDQARGAC
jgi:hypothetical protein